MTPNILEYGSYNCEFFDLGTASSLLEGTHGQPAEGSEHSMDLIARQPKRTLTDDRRMR